MNYARALYSANDVAKEVIIFSNTYGFEISNLKLQKLLYFIQAIFLNEFNRACFEDRIEAWSFGPVVPTVYHNYKMFGASNIPIEVFNRNSLSNIFTDISSFRFPLSIGDKATIDDIVHSFSRYTASELVDITHHQDPWINSYIPRYNNEISKESILAYFSNLKYNSGVHQ